MIDAIVCQNHNGKDDTEVEDKRCKNKQTKQTKSRHLTNLYSFIKCDTFLCYVQDLMKQLCISDMQVF